MEFTYNKSDKFELMSHLLGFYMATIIENILVGVELKTYF